MDHPVIDLHGDASVVFHVAPGLSFFTEAGAPRARSRRLGPTPSEKDDPLGGTTLVAHWGANNTFPQQVVQEVNTRDLLRPLIRKPAKLLKALNKASDKVEELYKTGRRKNKRITEGVLKGKQTPMKVVNDVAAELKRSKLQGSDLLLNFLHGLQSGMDSTTLLEALANGEAIPAPPEKKRGRKKKEPQAGKEATDALKAKRTVRKTEAEA